VNTRTRTINGSKLSDPIASSITLRTDFIQSDDEELRILSEINTLKENYSFKPCNDQQLTALDPNMQIMDSVPSMLTVSAIRVTGRPEAPHQIHAPWGYGDNFNLSTLQSTAPLLYSLSNRICESTSNSLTDLRDITINYRSNRMFLLDPHIDPALDGSKVFILGLKSNVVFTLTPDLDQLDASTRTKPLKIRTSPTAIALASWTDEDVDILLEKRALLSLTGDARYKWKHAIRTGVLVNMKPQEALETSNSTVSSTEVLCDWWGDVNTLLPREPERISVIFAFK